MSETILTDTPKQNRKRKAMIDQPIYKQVERVHNLLTSCGDSDRQVKVLKLVSESIES